MKFIMNEAELYQKSNSMQKKGVLEILKDFSNKIQWKNNEDTVIDIGCGDGSVTNNILKNYLPDNFKIILGCDISQEVVRYANEHYKDNKIKFIVQDIEATIPEDLIGQFDHVFSFYTLHWIRQQE